MQIKYIRKIFVLLIIIAPLLTDFACKKQPKCGCGEDMVYELIERTVNVYYNATSKSAYFSDPFDPYSSYSFCNPADMMSTLTKFPSGAQLLLSGKAYYECNYLLNAASNPYYAQYKVYLVQVTELKEDLYGKK